MPLQKRHRKRKSKVESAKQSAKTFFKKCVPFFITGLAAMMDHWLNQSENTSKNNNIDPTNREASHDGAGRTGEESHTIHRLERENKELRRRLALEDEDRALRRSRRLEREERRERLAREQRASSQEIQVTRYRVHRTSAPDPPVATQDDARRTRSSRQTSIRRELQSKNPTRELTLPPTVPEEPVIPEYESASPRCSIHHSPQSPSSESQKSSPESDTHTIYFDGRKGRVV